MLRQAPNIILVGEMRDNETASDGNSGQSLTGHLVFSTLHTNDAPSAITRMVDMGVPGYLVASSVIAVLAQRLVRVICSRCKTKFTPSEEVLKDAGITPEMAANAKFARGKGCGYCQRTGYRGRIGDLRIDADFREDPGTDLRRSLHRTIREHAIKEGMRTLYLDGIDKVLNGVTTFEEVYRVAKKSEQDTAYLRAAY